MIWQKVWSRRQIMCMGAKAQIASLGLGLGLGSACTVEKPIVSDDHRLYLSLLEAYSGYAMSTKEDSPWHLTKAAAEGALAIVHHTLKSLKAFSSGLYSDVCLGLSVIEWAPVVCGYGGRFSGLAFAKRVEFLKQWSASELSFQAEIAYGMRPLFLLAFYETAEGRASIGYDPPLLESHSQVKAKTSFGQDASPQLEHGRL